MTSSKIHAARSGKSGRPVNPRAASRFSWFGLAGKLILNLSVLSPLGVSIGLRERFLCKRHTTATLTLKIGGSESNRQSHWSPPSLPVHSWPVVVPKYNAGVLSWSMSIASRRTVK